MSLTQILEQEQEQYERECVIHNRLRELASGLHIPSIEFIVRLRLQDKETGKIKLDRKFYPHSLTRNVYVWATTMPVGFMDGASYADGSLAFKATDDAIIATLNYHNTENQENGTWGYDAPSGTYLWGPTAGRGNTAFSIDDNDIELPISHGVGVNQMEYDDTILTEGWDSGSAYYWSIASRVIDNNSAATIIVWEVGLIANMEEPSSKRYLLARDLPAGGVTVTTADRLIVDYETRVNF